MPPRACTTSCAPTSTSRAPNGLGNRPHPLATGSAAKLATLPTYYIMDKGTGMAEAVAPDMPSPAVVAANRWLPEPFGDRILRRPLD